MRNHGFHYVDPQDIKVGDWIVVITKPVGVTRMIVDARQVNGIGRTANFGNLPDYWSFDFDQGLYITEDSVQIPIVDGA